MLVCQDLQQMWKKWLSCSDPGRLGICRGCVCRGAQAWIVASRGRQFQWLLAPFTATPSITERSSTRTVCIEYTRSEKTKKKKKLWWEMKVRSLLCCDYSLQPQCEIGNVFIIFRMINVSTSGEGQSWLAFCSLLFWRAPPPLLCPSCPNQLRKLRPRKEADLLSCLTSGMPAF